MTKQNNFFKQLIEKLVGDEYRKAFFFFFISSTNTVALFVSCLYNYLQNNYQTSILNLIFGVACLLIIFGGLVFRKYRRIVFFVFIFYLVVMSGFLLVMGGPDQALLYWVLILPSFSYIFFGLRLGTIATVSVSIVIFLFYWTPFGNFVLGEGMAALITSVKLRFSMIYLVCALFGSTTEVLRHLYANHSKLITEQLEYSLLHDSLTNVGNQRFLEKYIGNITLNKHDNTLFGCLFIDVDNFKTVNDQYGHLFGNTVLCRIADILSSNKEAFVCRWGGDEFVVCFENTTEEKLLDFANYYRKTVAIQSFYEFPNFKTTISLGVKSIVVNEDFNFSKILDIADREMRTEKHNSKLLTRL